MSKVTRTKNINASAKRVWEIIADFGNVQNHNPLVRHAELLQKKDRGPGVKRRCHFYDGTSLIEKIISWDEGKGFIVELSETSMPFRQAQGSLHVMPMGPESSIVTFEMDFTVKYGLLGMMMDMIMMRRMMGKMLAMVLESMEHHVLTGELIGENGIPVKMTPEYTGT